MPNYFSLARKSQPDQPVKFGDIDAELCTHFDVPCDPVHWYLGWYDYVGFALAVGRDWEYIQDQCKALANEAAGKDDTEGMAYWSQMLKVVEYLERHYVSDAWARIGNPR
jgi:hypothetical protein